jgi:hypothetical protein
MYAEVFSPDSKTSHFNRAVNQVKNDARCTELLGNSKKITAYGEPTWNKWARARPIAYDSCHLQSELTPRIRSNLIAEFNQRLWIPFVSIHVTSGIQIAESSKRLGIQLA